jgi:hypothetical protein
MCMCVDIHGAESRVAVRQKIPCILEPKGLLPSARCLALYWARWTKSTSFILILILPSHLDIKESLSFGISG